MRDLKEVLELPCRYASKLRQLSGNQRGARGRLRLSTSLLVAEPSNNTPQHPIEPPTTPLISLEFDRHPQTHSDLCRQAGADALQAALLAEHQLPGSPEAMAAMT